MHASHETHPIAMRAAADNAAAAPFADAQQLQDVLSRAGRGDLWTGLARLGGALPPAGRAEKDPWGLLRGWQHPPGSGDAGGRLVRAIGSENGEPRPRFDGSIAPGGYGWWYVDAVSDDGRHGLTIIAFLGSVFSPYYKASGRPDPVDHAALNVALYGPGARWTMTERPRGAVARDRDVLEIGPSSMRWTGDALEIQIEERDKRLGIPWRRRVRGTVRVYPEALNAASFDLDPSGKHRWHCLAPRARIEVQMDDPAVSWKGSGYLDSNFGSESLEEGFRVWHWSRAHTAQGSVVCYEGIRRDGSPFASALRFDNSATPHEADLPMAAPLPSTLWQVQRKTRADRGHASVLNTWEDTPFYARSRLSSRLYGEQVTAVQESLDLDRFASPVVQFMLPYKMPRAKVAAP